MKGPLSYIEINRRNLTSNVKEFRKRLPAKKILIAVVKANAYGHGLKEVVKTIDPFVEGFQVDDIEELKEIRKYTRKRVYVFGYVAIKDLGKLVDLDGILGAYNFQHLKELNDLGKKKKKVVLIHLKIDALLGRQGILIDDIDSFIKKVKRLEFIKIAAIYSHFSNIEDVTDLRHANKQYGLLMKAKERCIQLGLKNILHHISATSGFLSDQKTNWNGSILRLGIGLYGLWPSKGLKKRYMKKIKLKPSLRWLSRIAQIKDLPAHYPIGYGLSYITKRATKIAIIPQGYSDGYDRALSNNSKVLIRGKECRVLGRIMMNMFVVDVSKVSMVKIEDEVVLLGDQLNQRISAEDLAERINTINYEIVARISPLLPRLLH